MPDDMIPEDPGDAADEPDLAATAPSGIPSVPPDDPDTGPEAEAGAEAERERGADDATSVVPATTADDDGGEATSVLAATTAAGDAGAGDEATSVSSRYAPVAPAMTTAESDTGPRHAKR